MQVILMEKVTNLGQLGDIVKVKAGYARNYLVPRGLALKSSRGSQKQADAMRRNRESREARDREAAMALASQFEGHTIAIKARKVISVVERLLPMARKTNPSATAPIIIAIETVVKA